MFRPDLVILKEGRPLVVVEAKARPIPRRFEDAVLRQLGTYATTCSTPWSILVDPEKTTIFRSEDMTRPWTVLSTGELLQATDFPQSSVVGERVLLRAVDRWVHGLPTRREILTRHPELTAFAKDLTDGVLSTEE